MTISANYPTVRPTLNLDFANSGTLDPRITFSRTSTATYYDGHTNSLAEQNMFLQSNNFSTSWTNTNVTASQTVTDPFGNVNTAWALNEGTGTGIHSTAQGPAIQNVTGASYTLSVYAQNVTGQYLQLSFYSAQTGYTASAIFDLSTGTLASQNSGIYSYPIVGTPLITLVSGTWYRCSLSVTIPTGTYIGGFATHIAMSNSSTATLTNLGFLNSYTGTSRTINLYGAQFEQRGFVNTYQPTTTSFISNFIPTLLTAPINTPRFAFDPVTGINSGIIKENQITNLRTYSQDLSNAVWIKVRSSVISNTGIAPDGTQTACLVVEDTSTNTHLIYGSNTTISNSGSYTTSFYAKAGGRTRIQFLFDAFSGNGGGTATIFNLSTGVVAQQGSATATTITPVGNGWYRCSATVTSTLTSSGPQFNLDNGSGANYTGDGYSGVYIWGVQVEANGYPSSYIPTISAQVTRAGDYISITGTNFTSWYEQGQGTLYAEGMYINLTSINGMIEINNGTQSSRITLFTNPYNINVMYKSSVSYNLNGTVATAGTSLGNAYPQLPAFQIQFGVGAIYYPVYCVIKKFSYYPVALTATQLQALTGS